MQNTLGNISTTHLMHAMLTYKSLITKHLSVLLTPSRQLRSSDQQLLSQPTGNTAFASRAMLVQLNRSSYLEQF